MTAAEILKREFDAEDGSFLGVVRGELRWDHSAFRRLTNAMYDVADEARGKPVIEAWIAEGFWYCDTWLKDWTSHTNFPRLPEREHRDAIELIHELAYFLFTGDSPYEDDALKTKAIG